MWKCSLPARNAGKILWLLTHTPISAAALRFVASPGEFWRAAWVFCLCPRSAPRQGREVRVVLQGSGLLFWVFFSFQRFSNLLSNGETPLWGSFTVSVLENSGYTITAPKKCALFPKVCASLLNNCDYTHFRGKIEFQGLGGPCARWPGALLPLAGHRSGTFSGC